MRIYIFSTKEPIFHPSMFNSILKEHAASVVGAAIFPKETLFSEVFKSIYIDGFSAFPKLLKLSLKRPVSMKTKDLFRSFGIQVRYFNDPNSHECIEELRKLKPDVVFNNQPSILKTPLLSLEGIVFLNRHTSELPQYRGIDPVFHALLDGKKSIGVSIHSMTDKIDAGKVYAQKIFPAEGSVFNCYAKAFVLSPSLFSEAIKNLSENQPLFTVDTSSSKYYRKPAPDEITRFRKMGLKYL
ncbi:MAG: formyltransferase family protein [Candidatus Omnitrophica bacterium]|nr:formyltransferase family protein [Candidatus Omnitrophota bacterium]